MSAWDFVLERHFSIPQRSWADDNDFDVEESEEELFASYNTVVHIEPPFSKCQNIVFFLKSSASLFSASYFPTFANDAKAKGIRVETKTIEVTKNAAKKVLSLFLFTFSGSNTLFVPIRSNDESLLCSSLLNSLLAPPRSNVIIIDNHPVLGDFSEPKFFSFCTSHVGQQLREALLSSTPFSPLRAGQYVEDTAASIFSACEKRGIPCVDYLVGDGVQSPAEGFALPRFLDSVIRACRTSLCDVETFYEDLAKIAELVVGIASKCSKSSSSMMYS